MIIAASGMPMPNDQPMINASAKSKPTPARNSCNDIPLPPSSSPCENHLKIAV
jgi:hypothetical protein